MIALKIFRLEDSEEADALSTLSEGEHVIGRGFLNVKLWFLYVNYFIMCLFCSVMIKEYQEDML